MQHIIDEQGARVVSVLLFAAIVAQLLVLVGPAKSFGAGRELAKRGVARRSATAAAPAPRVDVNAIVAAHLFGAAVDDSAPAARSDLPLVLVATFATSVPARGMAVLRDGPAGPGHLYGVGAQLPGGRALLREVRAGSILLERDGRLETLAFVHERAPINLGGVVLAQSASGAAALVPAGDAPVPVQTAAYTPTPGEPIDTAVPGAPLLEIPNSSP